MIRRQMTAVLPPPGGRRLVAAACVLLALSACSTSRDGRYIGTLSTQTGLCGLSASPSGQLDGVLTIRGDDVLFAPEEGVVVLQGRIDSSGHVAAANNQVGADHKPFAMVFEGDLHGDKVTGRYATPRCRASVSLARG